MTKEQAQQVLMNTIAQLKLTKKEYDILVEAIQVLSKEN